MNREFLNALATLYHDLGEDIYLEDFFQDDVDIFNRIFSIKKNKNFEQKVIKNVKKYCKKRKKATEIDEDFYHSVKKINDVAKHLNISFEKMCGDVSFDDILFYIFKGKKNEHFEQKIIKTAIKLIRNLQL